MTSPSPELVEEIAHAIREKCAEIEHRGRKSDNPHAPITNPDPMYFSEEYARAVLASPSIARALENASNNGHKEPCYYCGEPCNSLAGDPGKWPVALCHSDEPGVMKWHHSHCVSIRLAQASKLSTDLMRRCACKVDDDGEFVSMCNAHEHMRQTLLRLAEIEPTAEWHDVGGLAEGVNGIALEGLIDCASLLTPHATGLSAIAIERDKFVEGLRAAKFFADESVRYFTAMVRDHKGDHYAEEQLKASLRSAKDIQWAVQDRIERSEIGEAPVEQAVNPNKPPRNPNIPCPTCGEKQNYTNYHDICYKCGRNVPGINT